MRAVAFLLTLAILAGCAGSGGPGAEGGAVIGEAAEPRSRAKVHTELAALYLGRGTMGVALEELRAAVAADPDYAPAYGLFGLVYSELRENELAQSSFERALDLTPADPDINHNYGWFLCQTGKREESIRYFLRAIRDPLYQSAWRSYSAAGTCAMRADNAKDAEGYFVRALGLNPDEPAALLQLAQIRYRQGKFDEARRLVSRFNRVVESTAESLWLAVRVERKLGERVAEASMANQLRRRFPNSREYQALQRGEYD